MSIQIDRARRALAGALLLACAAGAMARQSMTTLPVTGVVSAISADGSVIVGAAWFEGAYHAYRLDSHGVAYLAELPPLVATSATCMSPNGVNIAGGDADVRQYCGYGEVDFLAAAAWFGDGPVVPIGRFPGDNYSTASGVSDNGLVCGVSSLLTSQHRSCFSDDHGFVWSAEGGFTPLVPIAPAIAAFPRAISSDGTVVAGTGWSYKAERAFVWTPSRGMQLLPHAVGVDDGPTSASAVSDDGLHIVGECTTSERLSACIWAGDGPAAPLGLFPGAEPWMQSWATLVSGDGSVVIGFAEIPSPYPPLTWSAIFIWDRVRGMRALAGALEAEYGVPLGGLSLHRIQDVSRTGRYLVGYGSNGNAIINFVIDLGRPAACIADHDRDGVVRAADFFAFLSAFFADDADVNEDGATTSADFFDFVAAFFNGC